MTLWEAAVLGVIQGLTEFLPISSTAHLLVARQWMGHANPEDEFTVIIQLGTLLSVLWYFSSDIVQLTRRFFIDFFHFRRPTTAESELGWLIILGTIPVVVVGGLFRQFLKQHFYHLTALAWVALIFALIMAACEWWYARRQQKGVSLWTESSLKWWQSLWIGCWQALALMPGASRSGVTICGGLLLGMHRGSAARFSFLLSLPSIFAAGVKEIYEARHSLIASEASITSLVLGTAVSAFVGYLSIAFLLNFLKKRSMMVFVIYRLILGATLLVLLSQGWVRG